MVALFRSGSGARGPIKPGAVPTAPERPVGFDKVSLAGIVAGGADPEDMEKARDAAPGKVQSLGRLVSMRDHETETLSIPGVVAASASWDLYDGVPAVMLRVLLDAGRESRVRGGARGTRTCATLPRSGSLSGDRRAGAAALCVPRSRSTRAIPLSRAEAVDAAVRAALGLAGERRTSAAALFGLHARRLGAREYASRIEGRVQNVAGVLWCRVTALGRFGRWHRAIRRRWRCRPSPRSARCARCPAPRTSCCNSTRGTSR